MSKSICVGPLSWPPATSNALKIVSAKSWYIGGRSGAAAADLADFLAAGASAQTSAGSALNAPSAIVAGRPVGAPVGSVVKVVVTCGRPSAASVSRYSWLPSRPPSASLPVSPSALASSTGA